MDRLQDSEIKNLRGAILQIIFDNHFARRSRLRLIHLQGALAQLFFDVSEDELITILEDMKERGMLTYTRDEGLWRKSRKAQIGEIQILPKGRNLVEKNETDSAVAFE